MARFEDLSVELVLGILEEVSPDDIVSISLASKCIYRLAIPRLEEHRMLRKQYTNFKNMVEHKPNEWHDPGGLLAHLLCNIRSNARIGQYVKTIDLDVWNYGARGGWKPDAVFERQVTTNSVRLRQDQKTNMEIIEEAVRAIEIIPTDEVDDWLHEIRRGNEDPLVALLLLHAPRLHTLKFLVPYARSDSSYLLKTIQRVTAQGSSTNLYPLHLTNVYMRFAETWESLDFVKAFMSLPSLTSIKTNNLFVDGRTHEPNSAILPQPSNVTDVSFRSGFLPEKVFSELFRGIPNLKSFAYDFRHLWRDEDYTPPFDCLTVLRSLEANASNTLEYLKLGAKDIETSQIVPLREFRALREFEVQTSRCFAAAENKSANLIGLLPVSLERLAMRWYEVTYVLRVNILIEAILDLVRGSKAQLPLLRMLGVSTRDQGESDALWECLASDETAQINPTLAFNIQGPGSDGGEIRAWADNVCTCGQDCFGNGAQ